ncbi:hypothetical protein LOTGIDRAFT_174750 [Lottia gigantea]|uniref:Uncharacterized protein n=1 Tax=Lottia gigantea TaxID=225164 RepID=V4AIA2_LOTGI|nr:hypothetical protein LOTGIDRAFT_174750 [Lottia gigantea]ESO96672.1 hypothetical protein LOTGIDRAFT_174750 [Lottia gigantea]
MTVTSKREPNSCWLLKHCDIISWDGAKRLPVLPEFVMNSVVKEKARRAYQADASDKCPDNTKIFAADMQLVILLPRLTTKEYLFVRKDDYVILWHEAIAGRLGINVASAYIKCINLSAKDNVVLWADNFTGQNKNWTLFTSLVMCVNQEWGPRIVTLKYLERGHTFMRADVNGTIENKMRKAAEILNFQDFVDLCDKASKHTRPVVLHCNDFHCFQDDHRTRQKKNVQLPLIGTIVEVELRKGSRAGRMSKAKV